MEEDCKRRKDVPCSQVGRINTVKTSRLLAANCIFNAHLSKSLLHVFFFTELEINSKIHIEVQGTINNHLINPKQKEQYRIYQQYLISNYTTEPK